MDNSREVASVVSLLLLILYQQSSTALLIQRFLQQRIRRRRLRLCFLNAIIHCFHYLRMRRNVRARNPRRIWVLPRPQLWFQQLLNDRALDHWWKENFRVSRATFEYICQLVGPALRRQDTHMRDAIPIEKRVGASLWRLATGECYCSCGLMIGLSKSAVVNCCHEFVQELCRLKDNYIKFPTGRADVQAKIDGFSERSRIPNIMGAVDGTHVAIKAPKTNHEDYFNRKHFYSYVMQGVVDSKGLYLSVSTGYPGSLHDARVLRLSRLFDAAENDLILVEPTVDVNGTTVRPLIVGDSAYPLKEWLLCPFKDNGALTREQKNFNEELSRARIVAEHAYGSTKGRWRVLQKRLDEDSDRIPDTIVACCILHNICIIRGDNYEIDDDDDDDDSDADNGIPSRGAQGIRRALVDYIANL